MHVYWKKILSIMVVFVFILAGCGTKEGVSSSMGATKDVAAKDAIDPKTLTVELKTETPVYPTGVFKPYRVEIRDASGKPVDVDKVYYFMNMEGMHHPTEGTMRHIGPGTYELFLPLAMGGEWYAEITVDVGGQSHTFTGYHVQAEGKHYQQFIKGYNADELGEVPPDDKNGMDSTEGSMEHHDMHQEEHGGMDDPNASQHSDTGHGS
ncbi:MAG: FixH family protein [Candidatus Carbobacillus sp.]|nr:FixH family protein [Candidatus Carbobacillus sp.]